MDNVGSVLRETVAAPMSAFRAWEWTMRTSLILVNIATLSVDSRQYPKSGNGAYLESVTGILQTAFQHFYRGSRKR